MRIEARRRQEIRRKILQWYHENKRDLPWRASRDPYAIWISEIMLQQTRVDTVIPYYRRFLQGWPNVQALAQADDDDVRAAWSGLGYYRRAQLMLKAARVLVKEHAGALPKTAAELRKLPGFGRYTAGAVASIAHNEEVGAVDGNVCRVIARLEGIEGDVTSAAVSKTIWERADQLAKGPHTGDLNQGLIELGALLCSPRSPACERCPVKGRCLAHRKGKTDQIPPPKVRAPRKSVELTAFVLLRKDKLLLEKQPEGGLFAGLWCLPSVPGRLLPGEAAREAQNKYGFLPKDVEHVGELKHVLTHRDLLMRIHMAHGSPKVKAPLGFHALEALAGLGLPTFTTRSLKAALPTEALARTELPERKRTAQLSLKL